ncbi:Membrane protease YdiL, CAAX protease family [Micromonospora sediminicola]|uniref:Membrane protease YdiL, CAAX protease family n=1 Tax=Micromonospora sediminicola TaxID=946078 RepID=A0A1A9B7B3_9ACTN|nr:MULTISPECIES: type II CAAX endopeptidase family protein [Micromonospora]PGH40997.1 CPBP family intramembrane metalloprotease [Micromonospora sp. WMMA1996]SBT65410.1 Membrane protease YdiL, CAAX protease family [Micromonospora sediminicola]
MTTGTSIDGRHPRAGRVVLVAGLGLVVVAAVFLVATGNTGVRYSADHDGTVPMWNRWIPALAGIALIRLIPPAADPRWPDPVAPYREAVPLLLAGVAFAAVMPLLGGEPAYSVLKLALLLGVPVGVFLAARRRPPRWRPGPAPADAAHRWGPALPVAVWLVLSYATPLAVPASDWGRTVTVVELVVVLLVGFAVNAVLEEVFYRRWLQTRWESLLGRWPAIVLASLVWAAWHVAIQGSGRPGVDLASVIVNQGVTGLFLGYLWSRYRRMWPPLVAHGAVNAAPLLLGL